MCDLTTYLWKKSKTQLQPAQALVTWPKYVPDGVLFRLSSIIPFPKP